MPSAPRGSRRTTTHGALALVEDPPDAVGPGDVAPASDAFDLHLGDVSEVYETWPTPTTIISDGAYGVRGFHGDTVDSTDLVDWYRDHIEAWTRASTPGTTLWFWGTEVGWATVHAELDRQGWDYVQTIIWDKGLSHIAGNVNGKTIRQFPVVTEVCILYQRRFEVPTEDGLLGVQEWLRHEWQRSGLPLYLSNEACGVRNAATRKYLTRDWLWYFPPGPMVARMAAYCNEHGFESGRPYFSLDGQRSVTAEEWDRMRYPWTHTHGLTNVWTRPPLHDSERLKGSLRRSAPRTYKPTRASATHLNQKPLEFMERLVHATTRQGDVVWEPFGGLASASVAAVALGRRAFVAEKDSHFAQIARERLQDAATNREVGAETEAMGVDG
ncbi:site-specific DNA-methyltransferase [Kytococcus schroeteri]|uniref:Methyltransferase n=1 Tax=Kytococcus schroeteri TaxID=138300 RepID=A0A2I1P820_9MICO|nr:site-specific DNA-methyltransferase [Kytococcus schroeteri]